MVEGDDARMPGLHHADFHPGTQAHLVQAANELQFPIYFVDAAGFTRIEQMHGNNVRHGESFVELNSNHRGEN